MTSKDSVTRMLCCKCSRRVAMEFKGWWKSCMKLQSFWNQVMPKKLQNVCFSISNVFHGWRFFTVTTSLLLFKLRPKTHYLYHMALELPKTRLNFNIFHTFTEESFLGKVKAIALRTHGKTMSQRTFQRYLLYMAIFLRQNRN